MKTRIFRKGEKITWSNQITEKDKDGTYKWYESFGRLRELGSLTIYKNEGKSGFVFSLECDLGIVKEGFHTLKEAKEYAQNLLDLKRV
jgi:hypothetical protein